MQIHSTAIMKLTADLYHYMSHAMNLAGTLSPHQKLSAMPSFHQQHRASARCLPFTDNTVLQRGVFLHQKHHAATRRFPSLEAPCFSATSSSHRQHQSKPQSRLQFNDAGLAAGDQCTVAQHASFPSRNPETQVFARISVLNSLLNHFQNHSWKPQKGPQAIDIQMTILATNPLKIGNECFK